MRLRLMLQLHGAGAALPLPPASAPGIRVPGYVYGPAGGGRGLHLPWVVPAAEPAQALGAIRVPACTRAGTGPAQCNSIQPTQAQWWHMRCEATPTDCAGCMQQHRTWRAALPLKSLMVPERRRSPRQGAWQNTRTVPQPAVANSHSPGRVAYMLPAAEPPGWPGRARCGQAGNC